MNRLTVEMESEHGNFDILVEYDYEPGFKGSYDEPPESDNVSIINLKIMKTGSDYTNFISNLKKQLEEYEREGGGRYNPADDR
jgi:uncharacterized protein YihD (DUF1040 family)